MTHKAITLLGMSGVGKTRLAAILRADNWFNYSVDYRIGSHYLRQDIIMDLKRLAMGVPELRDLLKSDSIDITPNISIDHLKPVSNYLGKLGNPQSGGFSLAEFQRRQARFNQAEIRALNDLPLFLSFAREVYECQGLVNDAGGSLCDLYENLAEPEFTQLLAMLAEHSQIVYIETDAADQQQLVERAQADPKPMYYRPSFLGSQLQQYLELKQIEYSAQIEPDDFLRWIFPQLYQERLPRYAAIARQYGRSLPASSIAAVTCAQDFYDLLN